MPFNRKALSGTALVVLAVLFVAVMLLVNVAFRGARIDLTQNHLYTLSDGTKKIIGSIDEPINLYLYYSDKGTQDLPQLRTYYNRVREMLQEMTARSGGAPTDRPRSIRPCSIQVSAPAASTPIAVSR